VREGGDIDEEEEACGKLYTHQLARARRFNLAGGDLGGAIGTVSGIAACDSGVGGCNGWTHQGAGGVDACVTDGGVVEPFWLGEAEKAVA
jgi:hypothetical protein